MHKIIIKGTIHTLTNNKYLENIDETKTYNPIVINNRVEKAVFNMRCLERLFGATFYALKTENTFSAVFSASGIVCYIHIHGTQLFAFSAGYAFLCFGFGAAAVLDRATLLNDEYFLVRAELEHLKCGEYSCRTCAYDYNVIIIHISNSFYLR